MFAGVKKKPILKCILRGPRNLLGCSSAGLHRPRTSQPFDFNSSYLLLQLHLLVVIEAFNTQTAHLLQSSLWVLHPKEALLLIPWYQGCSQVGVVTTLNIDLLLVAFIFNHYFRLCCRRLVKSPLIKQISECIFIMYCLLQFKVDLGHFYDLRKFSP